MDSRIKRLLKDLTDSDNDLRALAAMTLMKLDYPERATREEVLTSLMTATGDAHISVRFFARRAIDKIKKAEKLLQSAQGDDQTPIDARLDSSEFDDRLSAVMQIGADLNKDYKEKLLNMLETEEHPFVRASLISTLKLFLEGNEADVLSRFLSDPDSRVRSNCIEALEFLKVTEAIPSLFSALQDKDNRIRAVAAKALQSFGEEKVFAELKKMLGSSEEWMKGSAIYALSHIQAGEAVELIIETARSAPNSETRVKAIIALANYYDLAAHTFLRGLAQHGEGLFKETAQRALRLNEEKFGETPPSETLARHDESSVPDANNVDASQSKETEPKIAEDIANTVTQFFRKGKDEAVGLSGKSAISFAATDLKKQVDEICKEAGKVAFDLYQSGDMTIPDLLTIGHEVLRMNFFIQKYTDQEEKASNKKPEGFFEQIKRLFTASTATKQSQSQVEKFSKKREELFIKLGRASMRKYLSEEFQPKTLEPYFLNWEKLNKKLALEKKKLNN